MPTSSTLSNDRPLDVSSYRKLQLLQNSLHPRNIILNISTSGPQQRCFDLDNELQLLQVRQYILRMTSVLPSIIDPAINNNDEIDVAGALLHVAHHACEQVWDVGVLVDEDICHVGLPECFFRAGVDSRDFSRREIVEALAFIRSGIPHWCGRNRGDT